MWWEARGNETRKGKPPDAAVCAVGSPVSETMMPTRRRGKTRLPEGPLRVRLLLLRLQRQQRASVFLVQRIMVQDPSWYPDFLSRCSSNRPQLSSPLLAWEVL